MEITLTISRMTRPVVWVPDGCRPATTLVEASQGRPRSVNHCSGGRPILNLLFTELGARPQVGLRFTPCWFCANQVH